MLVLQLISPAARFDSSQRLYTLWYASGILTDVCLPAAFLLLARRRRMASLVCALACLPGALQIPFLPGLLDRSNVLSMQTISLILPHALPGILLLIFALVPSRPRNVWLLIGLLACVLLFAVELLPHRTPIIFQQFFCARYGMPLRSANTISRCVHLFSALTTGLACLFGFLLCSRAPEQSLKNKPLSYLEQYQKEHGML